MIENVKRKRDTSESMDNTKRAPVNAPSETRRKFLARLAAGGLAAPFMLPGGDLLAGRKRRRGTAEHCIFLWLGGGASQVDTFDPKKMGDPKKRVAGSDYPSIPTAISGAHVCEHLRRSAPLLDRAVLVRSVHHDVIDEHAAAVNRMHTGRPTSGTVVYPSMGSVVSHQLGKATKGVPAYVVMGYPNLTRGPGFLGARHGYVYLTDTESGPDGLARHAAVTEARHRRRVALLERMREGFARRSAGDAAVEEYVETARAAFRLTGSEFMSAFDLASESSSLRESYGSEFGQRCLLARRLIERGVRFIEVAHNLNFINGTGWDTHNEGQLRQHVLIDELDRAFSTLLLDLERRRLLEKTIVVISTEFGRPSAFDGRGGRGHQSTAFSTVLAGGGLRTGQVIGETDELSKRVVERPVSVPDFFATVFAALGIDPLRELYAGDRPVPITDMGQPIAELFS